MAISPPPTPHIHTCHPLLTRRAATTATRRCQAVSAKYAGWVPPLSYASVALLNADLGVYDPRHRKCLRNADIGPAVACPAGYFKLPQGEIDGRCASLSLPCPVDYECLCSPCKLSDQFEVYLAR